MITISNEASESKLPKGRKKRKQFKSRLYASYIFPEKLCNALNRYKIDEKKKSYEVIINEAFAQLEPIWTREKDKIVKEEMSRCLVFNPPPRTKKFVNVKIRYDPRFSSLIEGIILSDYPLAINTTDLITRMLSWYLREKGYLPRSK